MPIRRLARGLDELSAGVLESFCVRIPRRIFVASFSCHRKQTADALDSKIGRCALRLGRMPRIKVGTIFQLTAKRLSHNVLLAESWWMSRARKRKAISETFQPAPRS